MVVYLNWIDWTIVAILIYYGFQGWQAGFADLGLSFVTFLISLWLAIKFHAPVGDFITQKFAVPTLWTSVLGYVIVGFVAEAILAELATYVVSRIPKKLLESMYNKWLGIVVSVFNGFVIVAFLLLVILALPIRGTVKQDVNASKIGSYIVTIAQKYGAPIESTIQEAKDTAIKFLTIDPQSKESIALNLTLKVSDLTVDDADEREMLVLVNNERAKAGVSALTIDVKLIPVARAHSKDMFIRSYFSHVTPEGLDPGQRLLQAGIGFTVAGENLAYAPDLATAHQGLMNSPGHRANILDPQFHHVGIGIISTDNFGMMVTQDFTN